jgi:hypothetical protein
MRFPCHALFRATLCSLALLAGFGLRAAHAQNAYQPYYLDRDSVQFSRAAFSPATGISPYYVPAPSPPAVLPVDYHTQTETPSEASAIRRSDDALSFSFGGDFLNYKESLSPMTDGEKGWMPSFGLGASYLTQNNWYLAGDGSLSFGDVRYNGALENASTGQATPLQDWTHETVVTVDGKIGKGIALNNSNMLIPYTDLGVRFWDRDIRGAYGYVEDYSSFHWLGGLMYQTNPFGQLVLSTYGSYGLVFGSKMMTQGTTLVMGNAAMLKIGGRMSYPLSDRLDLFSTLDFTHFRNVNSGAVPDYQIGYYIMEPSSFTNETAARMGIAYKFN